MKQKKEPQSDDLVQSITQIAKDREKLARQAESYLAVEVENILREQSRDPQRIERVLDGLLDFCFDDSILAIFKKLCRYYLNIDPSATVSYVYAYRDLWDENCNGT